MRKASVYEIINKHYRGKYKPTFPDVFVFPLRKYQDWENMTGIHENTYFKYIHEELHYLNGNSSDSWSVFLKILTRARYLQVSYYPLMREIKDEEHRLKCMVRNITKKAIKQGKIVKGKRCEICKASKRNRKLVVHHPEPCNPMKTMTLCYSCHAKTHHASLMEGT